MKSLADSSLLKLKNVFNDFQKNINIFNSKFKLIFQNKKYPFYKMQFCYKMLYSIVFSSECEPFVNVVVFLNQSLICFHTFGQWISLLWVSQSFNYLCTFVLSAQNLDSTQLHSNSNLINYLFSLKNSRPCRDLNPGLPRYQADMLPTELSWLGQTIYFGIRTMLKKETLKYWSNVQFFLRKLVQLRHVIMTSFCMQF